MNDPRTYAICAALALAGVGQLVFGEAAPARVPPVRCVERAGTNDFRVARGHSSVVFAVSAPDGSKYGGFALKRIRMTLEDGTELSTGFPSVTVDLLEGARLSATPALVPAETFSVPLADRLAAFDLYLRNVDGRTLRLSRKLALRPEGTAPAILRIALPAAAGGDWTEAVHALDEEAYRRTALDLIRRAGVPSLQVTMTTPLDRLSFCVVNDAFYAEPGRQQEARPIDRQSLYQACSISKVPLAYFAVKMAQEGRLDLERPLCEYHPGLLDHFKTEKDRERAKRLTARIVLTHVSGLPNKGYRKMTFLHEPGERYTYSGPGIFLLQEVIERLKGRTLDVFAKEELFDRLGMAHSNYLWQDEFEQLAVYGFRAGQTPRNNNWLGGRCNAAYSLRTSAEEFTKFLQWFLRGADLTPDWRKRMFTTYVRVPPQAGVPGESRMFRGLGWVIEDSDEFGKICYHGGNNVSHKGMAIMIPERQVTLCYFYNGDHRGNLHGPLTDLFLQPKTRLYAHRGGTPPMKNADGSAPVKFVVEKPAR